MKFAKLVTVETRSLTHDYPTEEQRAFFWPYRPLHPMCAPVAIAPMSIRALGATHSS